MGASPPALVADLVARFERDRKVFLSPDYKEEQLSDATDGLGGRQPETLNDERGTMSDAEKRGLRNDGR